MSLLPDFCTASDIKAWGDKPGNKALTILDPVIVQCPLCNSAPVYHMLPLLYKPMHSYCERIILSDENPNL